MAQTTPTQPTSALAEVGADLLARTPESQIEPSLDRIEHLVSLLGDPHLGAPTVHIAGTNGKTSTARMVDAIVRASGLRTGLYTSPHLTSITERICLDGEPIDPHRFVEIYRELLPYLDIVDQRSVDDGGPSMTFFEVLTGMGFAAFADSPVDVAVVEVGLGGTWDATNVVRPDVSVITPIDLDHMHWLGSDIVTIAGEKAGIIKPGVPVVTAQQQPEVAEVLLRRCAEHGAPVVREGHEFGVLATTTAVGGQQVTIQGLQRVYPDVFLPVFGDHQAHNAAVAVAAAEVLLGDTGALTDETVAEALGQVHTPGRLEVLGRTPSVIVDAAHNPAGARSLAGALQESFSFARTIGIVSLFADKDAAGFLSELAGSFDEIVLAANSSPRSMTPSALAQIAEDYFDAGSLGTADSIAQAYDQAIERADQYMADGAVGIICTGSVVGAGDLKRILGGS